MSRRAARYTQADIARALRAFEQVNGVRATVQIDFDGTLRIVPLITTTRKSRKFCRREILCFD